MKTAARGKYLDVPSSKSQKCSPGVTEEVALGDLPGSSFVTWAVSERVTGVARREEAFPCPAGRLPPWPRSVW